MELEGVIERWQICNGDPSKWSEIQARIDYPTDEDKIEDIIDEDHNQEERKVVWLRLPMFRQFQKVSIFSLSLSWK